MERLRRDGEGERGRDGGLRDRERRKREAKTDKKKESNLRVRLDEGNAREAGRKKNKRSERWS